MATLITDSLVRVGQNMLLALAMLPCMLVGAAAEYWVCPLVSYCGAVGVSVSAFSLV